MKIHGFSWLSLFSPDGVCWSIHEVKSESNQGQIRPSNFQNKVYRVSKRYKIAGSVDQNIGLRDLKKLVQTLWTNFKPTMWYVLVRWSSRNILCWLRYLSLFILHSITPATARYQRSQSRTTWSDAYLLPGMLFIRLPSQKPTDSLIFISFRAYLTFTDHKS